MNYKPSSASPKQNYLFRMDPNQMDYLLLNSKVKMDYNEHCEPRSTQKKSL
jgi:hypothetical protein